MKYILYWKNEEIDSANDLKEAKYLQREYTMAYGGIVKIKKL